MYDLLFWCSGGIHVHLKQQKQFIFFKLTIYIKFTSSYLIFLKIVERIVLLSFCLLIYVIRTLYLIVKLDVKLLKS